MVHALRKRLVVAGDDEIEFPLFRQAVAQLDQFRHVEARFHEHARKRHVPEERFAREPEDRLRILADAP